MEEQYTKYEQARIIGARALQIAMGAPLLLKLTKEQIADVKFNPLEIAKQEFSKNVLPIAIKRPLPKKQAA